MERGCASRKVFWNIKRWSLHIPWKRWQQKMSNSNWICCLHVPRNVTEFPGDCFDHYNIYYIHSLNKAGGLRPPPQKGWRALRPRQLFRGFICWACEYSKYCNGQDSRHGILLGFLGTCRQQFQLEINLLCAVSASKERAASTSWHFKNPTPTRIPCHGTLNWRIADEMTNK